MGIPVISTPIEELRQFPKFVKIGKTAKEWENHIYKLFVKPWPVAYQQEERQLTMANRWSRKIGQITKLIDK